MIARRIEVVAAVACLVLALLGLLLALVTPGSSYTSESIMVSNPEGTLPPPNTEVFPDEVFTDETSWTDDIEPVAVGYIVVMVTLAASVVALGLLHGRWPGANSAGFIWMCGGLMTGLALIAGFSIGLFFLPAAIAALVTAAAAARYGGHLRRNAA